MGYAIGRAGHRLGNGVSTLMVNQRATHARCPSTEGEEAVQSCHHLP